MLFLHMLSKLSPGNKPGGLRQPDGARTSGSVPELGLAGAGRSGLMLLPLLPLPQHPLCQQEVGGRDVVVLVRFQSSEKREKERGREGRRERVGGLINARPLITQQIHESESNDGVGV